jgi:hypothetical protein
MGERRKDALRVKFDRKLKIELHGTKVTSNAGLLAYRELHEALGSTTMIESESCDNPRDKNTQYSIGALPGQSINSRLSCYEDTNDVERLCVDPAMRQVVGGRAKDRAAASRSLMGRFERGILTQPENLEKLMNVAGIWIDRLHQGKPLEKLILVY